MHKRSIGMLAAVAACVGVAQAQTAAVSIVDGKTMGDFIAVEKANWRLEDGALVADKKEGSDPAYLVTKTSYKDFVIHAEFWASPDANSGLFVRCDRADKIDSNICYEVNIFDQRKDPTGGTGAIVDVTKVDPMPKAGGKWNTYEITMQGDHLVVVLNGQKTADVRDTKHREGPIALQYGDGVIKFRKVEIKPL